MIVSQKLESGVRLKEQHVAKELGISATPIREAFKKLAADGFVEIKPYYGVVVRRTDEKESFFCRHVQKRLFYFQSGF